MERKRKKNKEENYQLIQAVKLAILKILTQSSTSLKPLNEPEPRILICVQQILQKEGVLGRCTMGQFEFRIVTVSGIRTYHS